MLNCHRCGRPVRSQNNLPAKGRVVTALHREVQTGLLTGGSAFYRPVNLCRPCAERHDVENKPRLASFLMALVLLVALLGLAAAVSG